MRHPIIHSINIVNTYIYKQNKNPKATLNNHSQIVMSNPTALLKFNLFYNVMSFASIYQNSLSGKRIGATMDQMNRAAVAQLVMIRTQTEGQPTSTNLPLSPTEVDQPVRSMAEYMLARENIKWKNEYE